MSKIRSNTSRSIFLLFSSITSRLSQAWKFYSIVLQFFLLVPLKQQDFQPFYLWFWARLLPSVSAYQPHKDYANHSRFYQIMEIWNPWNYQLYLQLHSNKDLHQYFQSNLWILKLFISAFFWRMMPWNLYGIIVLL